jgi:hypothetical protein
MTTQARQAPWWVNPIVSGLVASIIASIIAASVLAYWLNNSDWLWFCLFIVLFLS